MTGLGQQAVPDKSAPLRSNVVAYLIAASLYSIASSLPLAVKVNLVAAIQGLSHALYLLKLKTCQHHNALSMRLAVVQRRFYRQRHSFICQCVVYFACSRSPYNFLQKVVGNRAPR